MTNLTEKLRKIQCPINWGLESIPWTTENSKKQVLNKLDGEFEYSDGSSIWQKFSQRLVLAFLEYSEEEGDVRKMKNYLDMIENILDENQKNDFMKKHLVAVEYVNNGMLAHYHHKVNKDVLAESLLSKPSFEDLSSKTRAGILAIKSCCIMEYGPGDASKEALKTINKALELDSGEAEWHFLKGKCMARLRRYRKLSEPPSAEELECLRRAVQSTILPSHLVFCGQSILEYALFSPDCRGHNPRNFARKSTYISECVGLMRRAANLGENHPVILCRVAKGLMRQDATDVDELLHRCVHKSLELLPSSGLVNEVAGDYFRYREKDIEKAIRYYSIAAHHHNISTSYIKLFDLMLFTKPDSELDNEVCRYWEKRTDLPLERLRALRPLTAYYFFVKNDIVKAVEYWKEWIKSTYQNIELNCTHRSPNFVWTEDLTKDIVGEVQLRLRERPNVLTLEDEQLLQSFLETVVEARPDLNIEEITISREDRIKTYLLTIKPIQKRNILEKIFKVTATSTMPDSTVVNTRRSQGPTQNPRRRGNYRRSRGGHHHPQRNSN